MRTINEEVIIQGLACEQNVDNMNDFKTKIADFFQDGQVGFEVFILLDKKEPEIKRFIFYEKGNTFKENLELAIKESIENQFLLEDVEYTLAEKLADNQNKIYLIQQDEKYRPFAFLDVKPELVDTFSMKDRDDAQAVLFRFRKKGKTIWAYQHLWPIHIPNKKKKNFLVQARSTERYDAFVEMENPVFAITRKIDVLIMEDYIITKGVDFLQKHYGFDVFIRKSAEEAVNIISDIGLIENTGKLREYISRNKTKYARKMMRIKSYNVINMNAQEIMSRVQDIPRWKDVFKINEGKIVINTYKDVENLIDLFDERFTRSEVTGDEFDTDVKKPVASFER